MSEEVQANEATAATDPPGKPEFLPEEFWDGEAGSAKVEDLWNAFSLKPDEAALRAKIEPEIRAAAREEALNGRPENADGYELRLAEDFPVPAGMEPNFETMAADPLVQWWRDTAFELGLGQEQFQAGIEAGAKAEAARIEARNAEMAKLGDNGDKRVERVMTWLEANLGPDATQAVAGAMSTAATVEAFERMVSRLVGQLPDSARSGAGVKTPDQLRSMMADPRYQSDPAYREEVTREFQRTHGTAPYRGTHGQSAPAA